ncbi:Ca(2+)-dependent cysteine protease [Quaeritorhiza haematococci]|nr:Ca(2+)-dependent cysteine protease [Quaeritorhiza haematococci]
MYPGRYRPPAAPPQHPQYHHPGGYAPPPPPQYGYQQPGYAPPPPPRGPPAGPYAPPAGPPPGSYRPPPGPPPSQGSFYGPPAGPPAPGRQGSFTAPAGGQVQWQALPPGYMQQYGSFISPCNGRKKALLIGINYFGQKGQLAGCINDVKNIKSFIMRQYGFTDTPQTMVVLTDDQSHPSFRPTRANIIQAMQWLVSGAQYGDSLFFHYSGHGGQLPDQDGDEEDGSDETILPIDFKSAGQIRDDDMHAIMVKHLPPGVRLTAVFDSCHSGTALDLPYLYLPDGTLKQTSVAGKAGKTLLGAATAYATGGKIAAGMALFNGLKGLTGMNDAKKVTEQQKTSVADVVMFSGCKDRQTSADTAVSGFGATGAMSYALIQSLSRHPHPTYGQLLQSVRDILRAKYSQIPQLSSGRLMDMNTPFIM